MGRLLCNKCQWTCSVVILTFAVFLGIPTNSRVSGASLRSYAVLTLRGDNLEQNEVEKAFGFNVAGNKHPAGNKKPAGNKNPTGSKNPAAIAVSTYNQTPVSQHHNHNQQQHLQTQQQHQQYQLQHHESQQQYLQQPVVDIQVTGGNLQAGLDQSSSLLELGTSLMPNMGGTPLQASSFFSSSSPQRPPASQVAPTSPIHQLQYPSHQVPAVPQQQNIPPPPQNPFPEQQQAPPQIGHASSQHLESSSQLQQSTSQQHQFQEQLQSQQSASTSMQAQQPNPHLEQPSPAPPVQQTPPQQQESHFTPPQPPPPAQGETQHLSSQQHQPPPQVQQVSAHSHQSSSNPSQQSQQVISQQHHYSKPPPQESVIMEQYNSVVHTEPQSTPEYPQAPSIPSQQAEAVQESPQQAPSQLPPGQGESQHLSSQQHQPPPQVQQVSSHSHQSSSNPSQQSQQVISQQHHYSKPPPQESVILEQYQSVVHTEPQSTPEYPQASFVQPQLPETIQESAQQAPPQPQEPLQQAPQLSNDVQASPQQNSEVPPAPTVAEPSIDHEHLQSVETIPSEQSSSVPDHPPSTIQEVELPQEQPPASSAPSFLLMPQNINSPLQSSNFGLFNKPQLQENSQLSSANQPQDQPSNIIDKPGSLIAQLNEGSLLSSNSIPSSSGQSHHKPHGQATSSDSNEHQPLFNEQAASPSVLESTGGWSPSSDAQPVSGPTLVMDTSLAISSAAAVSSTHTEALSLIGDHDKPAMAEIQFGSTANHEVAGNTHQVTTGSTTGSQNSEGHIDGGSSQMYDLATMGEHNEVLVSGTSGSEAIGSVLQQSLADTIMAEAPVQQVSQQQHPVDMSAIELSPPEPVAEVEIPAHLPQIEPHPQEIDLAPQIIEDIPLESPQIEPQVIELAPPQHIEEVPVEVPQIEPQVIEAPIVPQVIVPDPVPAQQTPSQFNQIASSQNNLINASQEELIQFLISQQQQDELETLQKPADTNQINEAVNMAHSGVSQVQHSSVNQVSNNLIISQQQSSKVPEADNKISEKISGSLLKPAKDLNQMRFISDAEKIIPEQDGLFAAMLQ